MYSASRVLGSPTIVECRYRIKTGEAQNEEQGEGHPLCEYDRVSFPAHKLRMVFGTGFTTLVFLQTRCHPRTTSVTPTSQITMGTHHILKVCPGISLPRRSSS